MPKGVMWRQDDLVMVLGSQLGGGVPEEPDYEAFRSMRTAAGPVMLTAARSCTAPGALTAMSALTQGRSVALPAGRTYDPAELLDAIDREKVNALAIVGDAFAKPMLRALDADPGRCPRPPPRTWAPRPRPPRAPAPWC